ncbi:hypothetical protein ME7_00529 [Bartonella birtlesii LL-WM9]|uniref:Uncharacterized protein n=1 Tax=Bartonella birtlesii LL-WM9 TaxID=1094552 RepID=J0Q4H8_9HYPH|nr:hypothetical protein [Bartonella birtlesii]EJF77514.1 hypothetical protein ME7_00529 [Bartonella birtlesii LL-WM9]
MAIQGYDGNFWVYNDALVFKNGHVYENARVLGNAIICGHIYGHVRLYDNAIVAGDVSMIMPIFMIIPRLIKVCFHFC